QVRRVEGEAALGVLRASGDQLLDGPVERFLRLAERGGAAGQGGGVEPVGSGELPAQPRAVEAVIAIAWILDGDDVRAGDDLRELRAAPAEQGPEHLQPIDIRARA